MSYNVYILAKRLYDRGIYKQDKIDKLYEIGELTLSERNKILGVVEDGTQD